MKENNVIIIGGGAAGLSAALFASRAGAHVTLLEKNEKFGKKLYITGKGRCNLCNACDLDTFLKTSRAIQGFCIQPCVFFLRMRCRR